VNEGMAQAVYSKEPMVNVGGWDVAARISSGGVRVQGRPQLSPGEPSTSLNSPPDVAPETLEAPAREQAPGLY
jgi:hypothetical protein